MSGLVGTCGVIEFEPGWATCSSAEPDQVRADRDAGYEWLGTHDEDWRRAFDVQAALWRGGRMRAVGLPDLLIAAVAERDGGLLACCVQGSGRSGPRLSWGAHDFIGG
jgi:predicted nucleic acid-binding protein